MAAINFPSSSSSPWTSPSGVVYTFSNDRWSAASSGGGGSSAVEQLETPQSITVDKNYIQINYEEYGVWVENYTQL